MLRCNVVLAVMTVCTPDRECEVLGREDRISYRRTVTGRSALRRKEVEIVSHRTTERGGSQVKREKGEHVLLDWEKVGKGRGEANSERRDQARAPRRESSLVDSLGKDERAFAR